MATNQQLNEKLALDLGINLKNRRPSAKEVFKWLDIDLLPHSSVDTLLCEIYEWSGRNWRTTGKNLIGEIFPKERISELKDALSSVKLEEANIPDFEFTKEDIVGVGLGIPSLFDIGVNGDIKNAKDLVIKVNGVKKARITNIAEPGIEILYKLSEFAQNNSKQFRRNIKSNYITTALFYADSVDISFTKSANTNVEVGFAVENIKVESKVDTSTTKEISLKYVGAKAPFAATFVKGKDF
jgi:hypothetical protein